MFSLPWELTIVWIAAVSGTALSLFAIVPLLRRTGTLDVPNSRSSHVIPTPRGGGIGLLIGAALASLVWLLLVGALPVQVLLAALVMGMLGLADDRRGLSAKSRLLTQLIVGFVCGWSLSGFGGGIVGLVAYPVLINAVNFMDGINGISGLFGAVWGASALVFGLVSEADAVALVGVVCLGVCLGFLPWNFPEARTFLGDVGSYFLGALVAGGILLTLADESGFLGLSFWVLVGPVAVYLSDTGWTLAWRMIRRQRVTEAHREHVYQKLVDLPRGSHWIVSLGVGTVSAICAALVYAPWSWFWVAVVIVTYLISPVALRRILQEG